MGAHAVFPQPSTTDAAGLRIVRASFRRTLDRLGIDLEVLHERRVPAHGGVVLMWNQETHLDHLVLASAIPPPFSRCPVVCATVIGGYARMPRGSLIVRKGPLRVVFSEPIPGAAAGADEEAATRALAEDLVRVFESTKQTFALDRV